MAYTFFIPINRTEAVVFTNEDEAKVGGVITVADCGSWVLGDTRFKAACTCVSQCSGGFSLTIAEVRPLPLEVSEAAEALDKAEKTAASYIAAVKEAERRLRAAETLCQ